MGYQLRMHDEIRAWLTGLRGTEPELARPVGEAVLALLDAGGSLGPPLVVPLESVLRQPDDPREALDYSYQRQLEALTKIRRGVADVATSRKRVELQVGQLERQTAMFASQRADALGAGREESASEARAREAAVQEQLSDLRRQLVTLAGEEERLTAASQRLTAKVEEFRTQKETIKANYTAAEASQRVREALAEIGADASQPDEPDADASRLDGPDADASRLEVPDAVPDAPPGAREAGATDARDEPAQAIQDVAPACPGDLGPEGQDAILPPPGMMALRPGAPGDVRAGLLFVVEPQGTALVVAYVEGPGGPAGDYREVIRIATARLVAARSPAPGADTPPAAFISYDPESFLDEFFPGEETEVEIGAAALAARNRAHTLAEARQRMKLTRAQVARRMNVREERVAAIERAEPGATEVRTLAAYVRALGGWLEVTAHVGDERVVLK